MMPAVASRGTPFVGRDEEVARLHAAADRADTGRAQVVLVRGDAGIGKSRLVTESLARLGAGARQLRGFCVDGGDQAMPLLPLVTVLRQVPKLAGRDRARDLLRGLPPLARSLGLGEDGEGGSAPPPPLVAPAGAGEPLYGTVLDLVIELSADNLLVLVVEDVHWADPATLALLSFLARAAEDERLLLVATYRDRELHRRHPLRRTVAELIRLPGVAEIDLAPLGRGPIGALAAAWVGGPLGEAALDALLARGEGNPFFTEQLLAARLAGHDELPAAVGDLLAGRVEELPEVVQAVLRALAATGPGTPPELLAAATGLAAGDVE
ncbi:MAG: AAA family ATPase, partial [Acidimicrobiia bacterium]|nr:AAA family ATPase [Acidimicrobiia bacterium]